MKNSTEKLVGVIGSLAGLTILYLLIRGAGCVRTLLLGIEFIGGYVSF
jgi:hypothetical protein